MKWTNMFVFFSLLTIGFFALNAPTSAANIPSDDVRPGAVGIIAASQPDTNMLVASKDKFDRKKFRGFDRDDFKKFDRDDFKKGRFDRDNFKKFDRDDFRKFDKFK